ncbi:uncharacterized protein LOC120353054 isoform X1 [Nilaparvata lugens]|uniref:uncharacterized protein LOC120353054 isoform X1 n=1 Tax=Nilaparvata lugens TaxID=108931 RepID=UPI00193D07E9|nr:uncharacterized protein LOC120353054 isoform X1 [Nilaparvata lugens]
MVPSMASTNKRCRLIQCLSHLLFLLFITSSRLLSPTLLNTSSFVTNNRLNDTLRRALAELPWTDKPEWLKKNLHIMMTRANVDIEMRPFGVYTLNYMSFKDVMKTAYSFGNILYTKKLSIQTQY